MIGAIIAHVHQVVGLPSNLSAVGEFGICAWAWYGLLVVCDGGFVVRS